MAKKETKKRASRAVLAPEGEGAGKVAGPGTLMALFIVKLVLDQERLRLFLNNPENREEPMRSAGLTEEEIDLLTTPCFVQVCDHLVKAGVGPTEPDWPPITTP